MTLLRIVGPASAGLLLGSVIVALAWRDCMMLATCLVLSYRLLLLHADQRAPWRALAAALNALSAGLLVSAAGLALVVGVIAAWLGWWHLAPDHPGIALVILLAGAAACCWARSSHREAWEEFRIWLWLLAGVVVTVHARDAGLTILPCLFALAVGLATLRAGWLLSTDRASTLLRAGTESH